MPRDRIRERIDAQLICHDINPAWASAAVFTRAEGITVDRPARHEGKYPIKALLEWAFGCELAGIDLNDDREGPPACGVEVRLIEQRDLGGVQIDTSRGTSRPADDAETIANMVACKLSAHMALTVAHYASTGRSPDWMQGAKPSCEPQSWRKNRHGWRAASVSIGTCRTQGPRGRIIETDVRMCPITYRPSKREIRAARRKYLDWWSALLIIRNALIDTQLTCHSVGLELPEMMPWKKSG